MTQTQQQPSTLSPSIRKIFNSTESSVISAVEMLVGTEALLELENTCFKSQWDQLSNKCMWGTVYQSRAFVSAWYTLYQNQYVPIIVRSFNEGNLTGLLTVTKEHGSKIIHVAGVRAAHYQTWLAAQDQGEKFIKNAIKLLRREFPFHEINFYNTPPQTPINWAKHDATWKYHCTVRAFERPLMDFRKPTISNIINSKRLRKRINQIKKAGCFQFEHVTSFARFAQTLNILADQHDFRKAAKYNWLEFRVDPLKKKFLLELFDLGLLHVTLLTLNGNIIASIVDLIGNNKWIHGSEIATHCCSHAKYSPGIVNFLLLGQHLLHKGYHVYDLTPGHDSYKRKLSNAHDFVHEIKIKGTFQTFLSCNIVLPIRAITRSALVKSNLSTKKLKDKAYLFSYQLKSVKPAPLITGVLASLIQDKKKSVTKVAVPAYQTHLPVEIKTNSLSDLLDYEPVKGEKHKWDFMADAMHRLEKEEIPFTISRNGRLLFCCWLPKQNVYQNPDLSKVSVVLQELYYQHTEDLKLKDVLANVASLIVNSASANKVYLAGHTNYYKKYTNTILIQASKNYTIICGFVVMPVH